MTLRFDAEAMRLAITAAVLLSGPAATETHSAQPLQGTAMNRIHVIVGNETLSVYCATKHAVRAISEELRQEVKDYNIRVTTISPGAVRTELTDHITEPGLAENVRDVVGQIGVPASTMASMVAFAVSQPDDVDVNEILFRPTVQPV